MSFRSGAVTLFAKEGKNIVNDWIPVGRADGTLTATITPGRLNRIEIGGGFRGEARSISRSRRRCARRRNRRDPIDRPTRERLVRWLLHIEDEGLKRSTAKGGRHVARLPRSTSHSGEQIANRREQSHYPGHSITGATKRDSARGATRRQTQGTPCTPPGSASLDASTDSLDGARHKGRVPGGARPSSRWFSPKAMVGELPGLPD